ncbi:MAG: tRNA (adenosine(37)-N6)-threonylcarbamoyltransferase complex dimerization subunit type 1 TsaB [Acidobacteriota bacterium]|nr:tRNA (adenosine(37)-N6)-threonylcarbamoyltransferase complex dimerization subunit type 1 TsaB [Acidobacteriota bacterium]
MKSTKQPLILSLETSTRKGSVAVLRGDEILAGKAGSEKSSHSAQLLSDISEILKKNDLDLKQINLLAVAVGPGSFTGLRIGLSTAKALAAALKIPIVGISTLEAAAACSERGVKICVVLPAGRNEYFVQIFKESSPDRFEMVSDIEINSAKNLSEKAAEDYNLNWIVSAEIVSIIFDSAKTTTLNYQILPDNLAISVGRIGHKIFLQGNLFEYQPRPIYVRGADIGVSKNAK